MLKNLIFPLTDDIHTALLPDPHLMFSTRIYIDPISHAKRLLSGTFVFRIRDGELAFQDKMCGKAGMCVGAVMSVPGRDE